MLRQTLPTSLQSIYPSRYCAQTKVFSTSLQPIYPSRYCAWTKRYLQVFDESILLDIVLRQRRFLQVFNQSIFPGIVHSCYKSLTNLSFQTLYSVPASLQPIYPSNENKIKNTVQRLIKREHRIKRQRNKVLHEFAVTRQGRRIKKKLDMALKLK